MAKKVFKFTVRIPIEKTLKLIPIIIFILGFILLPTKVISVDVPFEEAEAYTIPGEEQYIGEDCSIEDAVIEGEIVECKGSSIPMLTDGLVNVKIKSITGSPPGPVEIKLGYVIDGVGYGVNQKKVISGGDTANYLFTVDERDIDDCFWELVSVPSHEVCKSVNKTRTIAEGETRCRLTTNYYSVIKEVNWLFGFEPIVKFRDAGQVLT